MPKCPKCSEEIDSLKVYEPGEIYSQLHLMAKTNEVYEEEVEFLSEDGVNDKRMEIECPNCNEVLFHSRSKAIAFLKGEKHKEGD